MNQIVLDEVDEFRVARQYDILRTLYREALTNKLSLSSALAATFLLILAFIATRVFFRVMFALSDALRRWWYGSTVFLAPFASHVRVKCGVRRCPSCHDLSACVVVACDPSTGVLGEGVHQVRPVVAAARSFFLFFFHSHSAHVVPTVLYCRNPDAFEWYADYRDIKDLLLPHLTSKSRVLHLGCGTSGTTKRRGGKVML